VQAYEHPDVLAQCYQQSVVPRAGTVYSIHNDCSTLTLHLTRTLLLLCAESGMFASSSLAENANGELFLMKYAKAPSMVYQLPCPGRTVSKTTATAASGSNGAIAVPRLSTTPGEFSQGMCTHTHVPCSQLLSPTVVLACYCAIPISWRM
jgi:hypothetical protein